VTSDQRREDLHITIDEYQAEYLEGAEDVNTSELCRAAIDAVIPDSELPATQPDRKFTVLVSYEGALSELPPINTNGTGWFTDE